ncbi:DUF6883 domain-containing protein [Methylobacterium sp. J-072]|uniref:DUF6883 domain-containing protein n=1 Tax=Methylobacterium sp. J-072 TaxID=2836651 RepID=UPI00391B759B
MVATRRESRGPAGTPGVAHPGREDRRLLAESYAPEGGSKAKFLLRFGFSADQPNILADALVSHYVSAPDTQMIFDAVGSRRIVCEGPIKGVDGREPWIRSV